MALDRSAAKHALLIGPDALRVDPLLLPALSNRLPQAANPKTHVITKIARITITYHCPPFLVRAFLSAVPTMSDLHKTGKGEPHHIRDGRRINGVPAK